MWKQVFDRTLTLSAMAVFSDRGEMGAEARLQRLHLLSNHL